MSVVTCSTLLIKTEMWSPNTPEIQLHFFRFYSTFHIRLCFSQHFLVYLDYLNICKKISHCITFSIFALNTVTTEWFVSKLRMVLTSEKLHKEFFGVVTSLQSFICVSSWLCFAIAYLWINTCISVLILKTQLMPLFLYLFIPNLQDFNWKNWILLMY